MTELDLAGLEKVGGTAAGGYYLLAPGVILARPVPGYRQSIEGARTSLEEARRISLQFGSAIVVLVWLEPVRDQDRGSRQVWSAEADPKYLAGLGLVGTSALATAIGSFFLGLTRPRIPTRLFRTLPEATVWAKDVLAKRAEAALDRPSATKESVLKESTDAPRQP